LRAAFFSLSFGRTNAIAVFEIVIGYLRVSTLDQTEVHQLEGLALDETFPDKSSGKDVKRPQLENDSKLKTKE
jgi:hypothetical protein